MVGDALKSGSFFVSGSTSDDARWTLAPPRPQTPVLMVLAGPFCFNVFLEKSYISLLLCRSSKMTLLD